MGHRFGRYSQDTQGADTMSIEIRTKSKFFAVDGLGLHFGTSKWEAYWNPKQGWIWSRVPSKRD
jgi:uncharacterized protein YfaQ (DUF2300 family)